VVNNGDIWQVKGAQGERTVCVVSLDGLDETFGACLALVLHPPGAYPDTIMSVHLTAPVEAVAVALNLTQLKTTRFDDGTCLGNIGPEAIARVDPALRAVLDL
jgi:mRNA interferase MazF